MSLLLRVVAAVEPILDTILHYLEEEASQIEGAYDSFTLRRTSRCFQKLFEHRFHRIRCAKQNKPFIFYELHHSLKSCHYPTGTFQLVDSLVLPVSTSEHTCLVPNLVSLSIQQQKTLLDCKPRVAYLSERVGWGVKSSTVVPKSKLLFAYYGEFIPTREATKRHAINEKGQAMNYILTIREHIPPSEKSRGGVLVSNIDASKQGSIARFVNHSCDPNTCIVMIREQGAVVGVPVLKSLRTIAPGEQITFNYGSSEVELPGNMQNEDNKSGPTILGKRSVPQSEERSEKDTTLPEKEKQERKRCFCGAVRCCGFLPSK